MPATKMQVVHLQPLYYVPVQKAARVRLLPAGPARQQPQEGSRGLRAGSYCSKAGHSALHLIFGLEHDTPDDFATAAVSKLSL